LTYSNIDLIFVILENEKKNEKMSPHPCSTPASHEHFAQMVPTICFPMTHVGLFVVLLNVQASTWQELVEDSQQAVPLGNQIAQSQLRKCF
jgi:hypothetical protein